MRDDPWLSTEAIDTILQGAKSFYPRLVGYYSGVSIYEAEFVPPNELWIGDMKITNIGR